MLHRLLDRGIFHNSDGPPPVTPGGVLIYGRNGRDVATIPFGRSHWHPPGDAFDVTADTIYDLASLTKPIATAGVLMKLNMDLDQPIGPFLPELTAVGGDRVTLAQLLGHAGGFPAHLRFFERLRAGDRAGASTRREALLRMAMGTALAYAPGTQAVYSDLGYIGLGFVIERITGKRLDQAVSELVTGPLGMESTFFVDLDADLDSRDITERPARDRASTGALPAAILARVAPTENCPYRGLLRGAVHDDNAHAGGGIFGHAGLFAPAGDIARFARAMVHATAGQSAPGGFAPAVVRHFFATSSAPNTTWRLGWDRPSPIAGISHAGDAWPRDGVGHLGFTGCSMWLDPGRGRYVVLLTNRVHPSRERTGIREFRRAVMDAVAGLLDEAD